MIRNGYKPRFEEIWAGHPILGRASLLPWDSETFGFNVASYEIGAEELSESLRPQFPVRFGSWTREKGVLLCSCAVPAQNRFWKIALPEAGFQFVDFGFCASLNGLQRAHLPQVRIQLRRSEQRDRETIQAIAAQSFHHGRYHADPLFPRELANLRYEHWIKRALASEDGLDQVFVMEQAGSVQGFYHVTVEGEISDMRLAAVRPELQGSILGFELYKSMLHVLKALGVRRVISSISGSNTAVMNLYSRLGFRFSDPDMIYHWHDEAMRQGRSVT